MKNEAAVTERDGNLESPWQHGLPGVFSPAAGKHSDLTYDCLIAGAGITGLTAGLLLQNANKKTIIVESYTVGYGTTGGTSAHINTFADTTYTEAESAFGEEGAQLFAKAVNEGFALIKKLIAEHEIDCNYEARTGYLYAETDDQVKQLEDLFDGAVKVGIPVEYTETVPCPVEFKKAAKLEGQAQFHPLKYLLALEKAYLAAGGVLLTGTRVNDVATDDGIHTADTDAGEIKAKKVIYATHIPPKLTAFNFRCAPYRSYVIGVKLKGDNYPEAEIYDMQDPYHYTRTHVIDGQKILLIGGNDHKTGHDDPEKAFDDLEKYIRKYYSVSSVKYKWSSQYYIPVDGLPYIGQMPSKPEGIYCATGFNGNGMMLGSVSAKVLADLVCGIESPYTTIFDPGRIKPVDGFKEFVKENADVAYHFVADRLSVHETDSLKRLKPGTGKVVEFEGKKVAAYRDEQGDIHALNPVCTHAKCIVNWNQEEKSWDCPCHGARFDTEGKVLNGPADKDLEKLEY